MGLCMVDLVPRIAQAPRIGFACEETQVPAFGRFASFDVELCILGNFRRDTAPDWAVGFIS